MELEQAIEYLRNESTPFSEKINAWKKWLMILHNVNIFKNLVSSLICLDLGSGGCHHPLRLVL